MKRDVCCAWYQQVYLIFKRELSIPCTDRTNLNNVKQWKLQYEKFINNILWDFCTYPDNLEEPIFETYFFSLQWRDTCYLALAEESPNSRNFCIYLDVIFKNHQFLKQLFLSNGAALAVLHCLGGGGGHRMKY